MRSNVQNEWKNQDTTKKGPLKVWLLDNFMLAEPSHAKIPIDFFESCTPTNDIEYGGNDLLQVYNRKLIKQRLNTGTQYVACSKVPR